MKLNTNKSNIFSYLDYKEFLQQEIAKQSETRGFQTKMAKAAKCQKSYLSQVLRSKYHITNEQAFRLCEFFGLRQLETDYFMELVNLARTDLPGLRDRILSKLKEIRESVEDLSKRYAKDEKLSDELQALYYSSWHWSAIHIAVGIAQFQSVETLADRLSISKSQVLETLQGLESMGLIEASGKAWKIKPTQMHLPKSSPLTQHNHANWRQRAVLDSQKATTTGLHYSLVMSHSVAEFDVIKQVLLESIDRTRTLVVPSANEELTCLCLDYFKII